MGSGIAAISALLGVVAAGPDEAPTNAPPGAFGSGADSGTAGVVMRVSKPAPTDIPTLE
jgi:hypothetical protein